jgi:hypothetical protein
MVLGLFGRKSERELEELRNTVRRLEEERDALLKRVERAVERERRAVAAKQQVEEELKKLRGQLQNAQQKQAPEESGSERIRLRYLEVSSERLMEILDELESFRSKKPRLTTVYLKPGTSLPVQIQNPSLSRAMGFVDSQSGYAIFYDESELLSLMIVPPLPVAHCAWQQSTRFHTAALKNLFEMTDAILVLIAHAGESFAMLATPFEVIDFREIKSSVKSKHGKGGWSQRRFERLREEDIKHHADKIKEEIQDFLEEQPVHVICSGEQRIIKQVFGNRKILYQKLDVSGRYQPGRILKDVFASRIYTCWRGL